MERKSTIRESEFKWLDNLKNLKVHNPTTSAGYVAKRVIGTFEYNLGKMTVLSCADQGIRYLIQKKKKN